MFANSATKLAGQNSEQSVLQFLSGAIVQAGSQFIILLMNTHRLRQNRLHPWQCLALEHPAGMHGQPEPPET